MPQRPRRLDRTFEANWTRRGFLAALGITGLSACDSESAAVPGAPQSPEGGVPDAGTATDGGAAEGGDAGLSDQPWSAWRELREAVQKSPDSLVAQADLLVAGKDPDAIFRFVRDRIATYPPRFLQQVTTSVRWGTRATLRGGGGTARERAELLAELYRKAGFSAEVVQGWRLGLLADDAGLWACYTRTVDRTFDPQITTDRLRELLVALGRTPPPAPTIVDDRGAESGALADDLLAALPATFVNDVTPFLPGLPKDVYVPLVRVTVGGADKYANPLHPAASFGDSLVQTPSAVDPIAAPLDVSITLSVSTTADPTKRTVVASANYVAGDVVGRQVVVRFASLSDARALAKQTLGDPTAFVPVIAVTGLDLSPSDADALTHTGTIVTVGGDIVVADEGKPVTVNGVEVAPATGNAQLASKVANISVTALPQTFPQVELRVTCTDSAGKPVDGLAPGALTVTDAAAGVGYLMRQNTGAAPRVAFLIDQTLSQPSTFLDPTQRTALGVSIGQLLYSTFPGALVQVTALSGAALTPDGYQATDAQGVGAAFNASFGTSQPIYADTASALASSPSLVVLFSDGIVTETPAEVAVARGLFVRGTPIITVSTSVDPTTINDASMQELAALTGGTNIKAGDFSNTAAILTALNAAFDKIRNEPVVLTYTASVLDPGQHEVVVSAANGVSGKATYTVPAPANLSRPRALAGVYLSVKVGTNEIVRTLAGWRTAARPAPGETVPEALLNEVRGMLLGNAVVSFEAGAPSTGTLLDDALGAKLSMRPAAEAAALGDLDGVIAAVAHGVPGGLERLSFLHAPPIPSADSLTFEEGLRTVLLVSAPRFGTPPVFSSDVLGQAGLASLAKDPATAVRATLAAGGRIAIGEGAVFDESTVSLLSGKNLIALPRNTLAPDQLTFAPVSERDAWSQALTPYAGRFNVVPDGGGPVAFYSVDSRNSEVFAVLDDGSGGGKSNAGSDAAFADAYFTVLKIFLQTFEVPGLGFVLAFGRFVVAAANLATSCFNGGPPDGADPLGDLVGDLASAGAGSLGKRIGGAAAGATGAASTLGDFWDAAKAGATLGGKK